MVHSGSASPMKTTPSASPHLTVSATAPSLVPLVPPPGDTTDLDLTPAPAKLLATDLTSNSDLTQPSTPTPADAEPPVVTPAQAITSNSSPASARTLTQTQTPVRGLANGRTSGRKRTPKACDCCGPNGKGHNDGMSGRGRGRGRGRARGKGRGTDGDEWDTPKRKLGSLLTTSDSFDLTNEKVEEAEEEVDKCEGVQRTPVEADSQAQTPVALPVTFPQQVEPTRNFSAQVKVDAPKKEELSKEGSGSAGAGGKAGGDSRDVEVRFSGVAGRGATAVRGRGWRGPWGASSALKIQVEGGIKREGFGGFAITNQSFAIPRSMLIPRQVKMKAPEKDQGGQLDLITTKSPLGNGDTVNLSDSEPEEEAKDGNITLREMENGVLSISQHSESPLDLDSEMQVDQTPDQTDLGSVALTLSNGDVTDEDHSATSMEVETSHPVKVVPQCQGPITIDGEQHHWALRDHWLYCQTGTWEKKEGMVEAPRPEGDGKTQDEDQREQLIHTIHEFLESFYIKYGGFIPLSEADVLEYLKKKGNCDLSNMGLDIKGEMSRYRAALASAPVAGFMVTYNKHTLSLEDLGTLEEQNWLNDQIINMYGELIMEATQHKVHFFNSFFHKQLVAKGYEGVKRWTKKVDLFSKWLLLFPIHLEIHWSLVTVTMATKTISYYDSQGIVFRHTTDNILKYLLSEAREKKQTAFQRGWKITIIKGIPQQKNDSDCGVFVLEYCRCLSVRQPLQFSQEDMPRIRKRIYKELCDCDLTK